MKLLNWINIAGHRRARSYHFVVRRIAIKWWVINDCSLRSLFLLLLFCGGPNVAINENTVLYVRIVHCNLVTIIQCNPFSGCWRIFHLINWRSRFTLFSSNKQLKLSTFFVFVFVLFTENEIGDLQALTYTTSTCLFLFSIAEKHLWNLRIFREHCSSIVLSSHLYMAMKLESRHILYTLLHFYNHIIPCFVSSEAKSRYIFIYSLFSRSENRTVIQHKVVCFSRFIRRLVVNPKEPGHIFL